MFQRRFIIAFLAVVLAASIAETQSANVSVESIGMTVSDMDRAVEFYSALTFQKISDVEVLGEEFEHLEGVFGARMRIRRKVIALLGRRRHPAPAPKIEREHAGRHGEDEGDDAR